MNLRSTSVMGLTAVKSLQGSPGSRRFCVMQRTVPRWINALEGRRSLFAREGRPRKWSPVGAGGFDPDAPVGRLVRHVGALCRWTASPRSSLRKRHREIERFYEEWKRLDALKLPEEEL